MKDSICYYIDESHIDEFECTEKMFCSHNNCTDCDCYKQCEFCLNEPFCFFRHGRNYYFEGEQGTGRNVTAEVIEKIKERKINE